MRALTQSLQSKLKKRDDSMSKRGLNPQQVKPFLAGVINIQITPFKSSFEIDEKALRDNTRFMIEKGIVKGRGIQVIGGSNGEGFSLSDQEYRRLINIVVEEADGKVPICIGCVRAATEPVIHLAQYAEEVGADAIMVLAPHYYPDPPDDVVYDHFKAIADATNIAIMIYNNPHVTGKDCSIELLKETTSNMFKLREVAYRFSDRFILNSNTYRYMMPLDYQLGVVGFNTFFGNIDPVFALNIHEVAASGDFGSNQEIWTKTLDLYKFAFTKGMYRATAYGKEMARIAGRPMGSYERFPLQRPVEEERVLLSRLMEQAGIGIK
jgi:4-hydroxy-tetrahydrodipicolinate synthase